MSGKRGEGGFFSEDIRSLSFARSPFVRSSLVIGTYNPADADALA